MKFGMLMLKEEKVLFRKASVEKKLPTVFKNSQSIKALKRSKDVFLCIYKNQFDFDFNEYGNYICITKTLNIDTIESNKKYDKITIEVKTIDVVNDKTTKLDLTSSNLTTLNNNSHSDILTKLNIKKKAISRQMKVLLKVYLDYSLFYYCLWQFWSLPRCTLFTGRIKIEPSAKYYGI